MIVTNKEIPRFPRHEREHISDPSMVWSPESYMRDLKKCVPMHSKNKKPGGVRAGDSHRSDMSENA